MKFTTKDLINVGIYTAIYIVVMFAIGVIGFLGPAFMPVAWALGIIANGLTIALYIKKVPKFGVLTILMTIQGIWYFVSGHTIYSFIICALSGLLGDFVASKGDFRDKQKNAIAYALLGLQLVGPFIPVFIDREAYLQMIAEMMNSPEYAIAMDNLFSNWFIIIMIVVLIILGYFAGLFGQKVVKRNFSQARNVEAE